MIRLMEMGIPTHFIKNINMREQLVKAVEIIPIEVIVRNKAAGSFCERFGLDEGATLPRPIIEFCLKSDELNDPFITDEHIFAYQWAEPIELDEVKIMALRINDYLSGLFMGADMLLVDFKIEFGRLYEPEGVSIVLADEISPDSCRLWDLKTGDKMDKDRFRKNMGGVEEAYREVARRLGVIEGEGAEVLELAKTDKKPIKGKKK
jgi:phosphoribosylaminoimidazole-succinocarboxamide synthase